MSKKPIVRPTVAAALLAVALTGAHGTGTSANALPEARAIEGAWEPTVSIRDCQTGAVLFSFLSVESYIRGGTYIGEGMGEPANRALGVGTWRHVGGRTFTAAYQFFAYNPDGTPLGRLRVSSRVRLSADGESFVSRETAQLTDLNGTVLQDICGTRHGHRLH